MCTFLFPLFLQWHIKDFTCTDLSILRTSEFNLLCEMLSSRAEIPLCFWRRWSTARVLTSSRPVFDQTTNVTSTVPSSGSPWSFCLGFYLSYKWIAPQLYPCHTCQKDFDVIVPSSDASALGMDVKCFVVEQITTVVIVSLNNCKRHCQRCCKIILI